MMIYPEKLEIMLLWGGDTNNQSLKDVTKNLTSEIEKKMIKETLLENEGNRNNTAAQLGITVRTLYNKIKEYNIKS